MLRFAFYPRPPGGGRQDYGDGANPVILFLSTPSGWRATLNTDQSILPIPHFYPRPPGGGRLATRLYTPSSDRFLSTPSGWRATVVTLQKVIQNVNFYPRPPGGGRRNRRIKINPLTDFYPRPPGGGRRHATPAKLLLLEISIHALRVEGDLRGGAQARQRQRISIHALRVEGDMEPCISTDYATAFLSTPSGWRATSNELRGCTGLTISIHALRVEGDVLSSYFVIIENMISIHALRVEGDVSKDIQPRLLLHFYPRPPGGGRPRAVAGLAGCALISIHALRVEGDQGRWLA